MYDWLIDATRDSSQVVTASRRLARVLQTTHATQQAAAGQLAWATPSISEWKDWAGDLIRGSAEYSRAPLVISNEQSKILWERCLRRELNDPLLNIGLLAKLARDSWGRLREWRVSDSVLQQSVRNKDQRLFAIAVDYYQSILSREGWVDEFGIIECAIESLRQGHCTALKPLTLAGFDRISPQLQDLLDAYVEAGGTIRTVSGNRDNASKGTVSLSSYETADAELRSAGVWARQKLTSSPGAQIGIVVSQLEQDAQRSVRLVKEGLIPGWQNAARQQTALINVSYGKKLADYPAIATALLALRWLYTELSTIDVSRLLRSSVLGETGNVDRIRTELKLRNFPDQHWTASQLLDYLRPPDQEHEIAEHLRFIATIEKQGRQLPQRLPPGGWVDLFNTLLEDIGWPGDDSLSSDEFQTINRWRELLNEVGRLELVAQSMTIGEALSRISSIATETIFQPESKASVVHVLGPLEAAGLEFDFLWVAGANSGNWPPPSRAMTLVARDLQREYELPDATPADTLAYAERVIQRLAASSPSVVFSYAHTQHDAQQSASELLNEVASGQSVAALDPGWNAAHSVSRVAVVNATHDVVPQLSEGESLAGGASTIQAQFVEPFSAFVAGRLGVRNLWPIQPGLPPNVRGILIHNALQRLYGDCPRSVEIRAWDEQYIVAKTEQAVGSAFRVFVQHADETLSRILALEKERVGRLLRGVISFDADRNDFVIAAVEKSIDAEIAGLQLRVRIDRLDLDADMNQVIIDYKTGSAKRLLGRDKLPTDMQLIVYACALPGEVSGVALFNVDSRGIALDAAGRDFSPKLDWDQALPAWQEQVQLAVQEIIAGDVRLNTSLSIQQSRALALLSRVRELQLEH
ncbi:MAG: PD-(D/E)XK nuclease family protein [Woeseiaceae bacterium]